MKQYAIEIVEFKLAPNVTEAEFLAANQKVAEILTQLTGFVERSLCVDGDGKWIDLVKWVDMKSAKAAAEQVMKIEEFGAFMKYFDMESVKMHHYETKFVS